MTTGRLLEADAEAFRNQFNVHSFMFKHALADHELLQLPRIALTAERMLAAGNLEKFVALGGRSATPGKKFSAMPPQKKLAETVRQLAEANVWLKITSADAADPAYAELLQSILKELEELAGFPMRQQITWSCLTLFLASPMVVTPYHIDHESNFLFQIRGEKDLSLFDPADRELLTEREIEDFYAGNFEAAVFRDEAQSRGQVYRLKPGTVVHHPPLAPHWVQNSNNVSISASVGFCLRFLDRRARVYQVNHYLRKAGIKPAAPGISRLRDNLKAATIGLFSNSKSTDHDEILFSGLSRLLALPRLAKRLFSKKRPASVQ
jgi:hypothetical protein